MSESRAVPGSVISDVWVGLVAALGLYEKYEGLRPSEGFLADALTALQPFHHGDEGRMEQVGSWCSNGYIEPFVYGDEHAQRVLEEAVTEAIELGQVVPLRSRKTQP